MEVIEQRYVARILEAVAGNKTAATRILGIERDDALSQDRALGDDRQVVTLDAPFCEARSTFVVDGEPCSLGQPALRWRARHQG